MSCLFDTNALGCVALRCCGEESSRLGFDWRSVSHGCLTDRYAWRN